MQIVLSSSEWQANDKVASLWMWYFAVASGPQSLGYQLAVLLPLSPTALEPNGGRLARLLARLLLLLSLPLLSPPVGKFVRELGLLVLLPLSLMNPQLDKDPTPGVFLINSPTPWMAQGLLKVSPQSSKPLRNSQGCLPGLFIQGFFFCPFRD